MIVIRFVVCLMIVTFAFMADDITLKTSSLGIQSLNPKTLGGYPRHAGFRESQTEYRMKNHKYFRRNLIPGMLGWFKMTHETSIEDIEWMLARSAAFNAGYGFVCGYKDLEENGRADAILSLLTG